MRNKRTGLKSIFYLVLFVSSCGATAGEPGQKVGKPLNLESLDLELVYENDFSGADEVVFESAFVDDGKRNGKPPATAEWIAEGAGDAEVCAGRLQVAPVAFKACGEPDVDTAAKPSHMVTLRWMIPFLMILLGNQHQQ